MVMGNPEQVNEFSSMVNEGYLLSKKNKEKSNEQELGFCFFLSN